MEVIAGLHQLKVPIPNNPIGYVLPYLFEVPGGCAIIDPGWNADESEQALQKQMSELGLSFSDVKQIIVTHMHPDHFGLAGKVRAASGAPITVHEADVQSMQRWRGNIDWDAVDAWFRSYGLPEMERPAWMSNAGGRRTNDTEPDVLIQDGTVLKLGDFELETVWTPGHSAGHACFYMRSQELLLSGDHVLPTISPNVSLWPGTDGDPLSDYLASLKKLRGFTPVRVLPAHEYDFEDLHKRLDELEAHHDDRLEQMLGVIRDGGTTAYDVARGVRWSIGHYDNFDSGNQRAAVTETISHIRYLVGKKRLEPFDEGDGVFRYRLP